MCPFDPICFNIILQQFIIATLVKSHNRINEIIVANAGSFFFHYGEDKHAHLCDELRTLLTDTHRWWQRIRTHRITLTPRYVLLNTIWRPRISDLNGLLHHCRKIYINKLIKVLKQRISNEWPKHTINQECVNCQCCTVMWCIFSIFEFMDHLLLWFYWLLKENYQKIIRKYKEPYPSYIF